MEQERHRWLDLEAAFYALDELFGDYNKLISSISEGYHPNEGPDPVQQFRTIKALNAQAILQSNTYKPVKKDVLQRAMYSAARFAFTNNMQDVTTAAPEEVRTSRQLLQSLSQRMSVYVTSNEPDRPIVMDTG
ncbi:hypothetical protein ACA910_003049 [Epithemia clementina (nom. ined.)]